jgi:HK97 gp10 family phage protein
MSFKIEVKEIDRLHKAMKDFQGDTEKIINDVLHNEASPLIQEGIRSLIPISGRTWKGKRPPAKVSKSLTDQKGNLSITVKTTSNYHYLYFPDDGSNTRRHAGNKQFFLRGGQSQENEIVNRCISKLTKNFDDAMN